MYKKKVLFKSPVVLSQQWSVESSDTSISTPRSENSSSSSPSSPWPWDPGLFGGAARPSLASLACCCSRLCLRHLMRRFWNQTLTWGQKNKTRRTSETLYVNMFLMLHFASLLFKFSVSTFLPELLWAAEPRPGGTSRTRPCTAAVRTPSPAGRAARWWSWCASVSTSHL